MIIVCGCRLFKAFVSVAKEVLTTYLPDNSLWWSFYGECGGTPRCHDTVRHVINARVSAQRSTPSTATAVTCWASSVGGQRPLASLDE